MRICENFHWYAFKKNYKNVFKKFRTNRFNFFSWKISNGQRVMISLKSFICKNLRKFDKTWRNVKAPEAVWISGFSTIWAIQDRRLALCQNITKSVILKFLEKREISEQRGIYYQFWRTHPEKSWKKSKRLQLPVLKNIRFSIYLVQVMYNYN